MNAKTPFLSLNIATKNLNNLETFTDKNKKLFFSSHFD
jgi:hypothetical protein